MTIRTTNLIFGAFFLLVTCMTATPDPVFGQDRFTGFMNRAPVERCLECHRGIEEISVSHPLARGCVVCHGGNGQSEDKEEAHASLIFDPDAGTGKRNPSALKVVRRSCGKAQCHSGHADNQRNHVDRVLKSQMGTLAGVIAAQRYLWAGQTGREARYGVYPVRDEDGHIPDGAVESLEELPFFSPARMHSLIRERPAEARRVSGHIGDDLLREKCFQCHLDASPPPGQFRSQGCAACHFSYHPEGRYQGKDPMVSKTEPGHPDYHTMKTLPPRGLCRQCHRAFGKVAVTPAKTPDRLLFPGKGIVKKDVHLAAGMECIDCHSDADVMGDGNIYSHQYQAVEIRCETCHGTPDSYPLIAKITDPRDPAVRLSRHYKGFANKVGDAMVVSSRQRKLTNVKFVDRKIVTYSKRTGKAFITPLIKGKGRHHTLPGHQGKLECTACHSAWVAECAGCAATFSDHQAIREGTGWRLAPFELEAEEPALMVGPRGKVMPMSGSDHFSLTILDEKQNILPALDVNGDSPGDYRDWRFTSPHAYSGSNPAHAVAPHSVSTRARRCVSCHLSPGALGLGEGDLQIGNRSTGESDTMLPLVRTPVVSGRSKLADKTRVSARGEPVAAVAQPGARPFNQEEITRILRVGNCIPCHRRYNDPIYMDMEKSYKYERKIGHRTKRNKILDKR